MDIRFGDHSKFHRAAAGMVGGSFLFGLALHPLTPMAPLAGGVLGMAAGAAIAHGRAPWRMLAAGAATVPLLVMAPSWLAFAIVGSVLSLGLAIDGPRGIRGLVSVGLGVVTTLVAMWCALRIGHAEKTASWPLWIKSAVPAMAMGMVGVLTMLPRHLKISSDPVTAAIRALPTNLDAEVRDLCNRSAAIWTTAKERLADNDSGKLLVRDGVLKALEVATRSAAVNLTGDGEVELDKRMAELDKRIAAATDAEVKTQYQSARAALDDQRRYRERIRQGRERLVARMHNHVAALEKFQLAATGLEAARVASADQTAMQQLEELSQDVAASGEALAEIELGAPAAAMLPKADALVAATETPTVVESPTPTTSN